MKTAGSGTKSMQSIGQASIVPADVPLSSSSSNLDLHSEAREYPAPLFSPSNFSFPHLSNPQMLMPIAMHLREDRSIRRPPCTSGAQGSGAQGPSAPAIPRHSCGEPLTSPLDWSTCVLVDAVLLGSCLGS
jgi:hypothetical protein